MKSIKQGLTEAVAYRYGKINVQKTPLPIKPEYTFSNDDIKRMHQRTGLCQMMFACSLGE